MNYLPVKRAYANEFSWSVSRYRTFQECKRKYYYQYYDWNNWWISEDTDSKRITNVMRHLQSRSMWVGSVTHHFIRFIIERSLAQDESFVISDVDNILTRTMHFDWENSVDWLNIDDHKVFCGLSEHYYDMDYEDYCGYFPYLEKARNNIHKFFNSNLLQSIKRGAVKVLELETSRSYNINCFTINLIIDLATCDKNGNITITDWKTGKPSETRFIQGEGRDNFDALQLNLYAMYICDTYNIPYNGVIAQQIFLPEYKVIPFTITSDSMELTKNTVMQSSKSMLSILCDQERNIAEKQNFPLGDNIKRCRGCNFRGLCYPKEYSYPRFWRREEKTD